MNQELLASSCGFAANTECSDAARLMDVIEEEVATTMFHESPEQYWDFVTDIATPVVAGLAKADATRRERIRAEVTELARQSMQGGKVRLSSTATVIVGTR